MAKQSKPAHAGGSVVTDVCDGDTPHGTQKYAQQPGLIFATAKEAMKRAEFFHHVELAPAKQNLAGGPAGSMRR